MDMSDIRMLLDYNRWANERVLRAAADLNESDYAAPARLSFGSIRGTLAHVLGAEVTWLARCRGTSPGTIPSEKDFPTLSGLRDRWQQQDAELAAFLASPGAGDASRQVTYRTTSGQQYSTPLGQIVAHVVNHGTQFRAEAAVTLSERGHSPGDLDLILYLRTTARREQ